MQAAKLSKPKGERLEFSLLMGVAFMIFFVVIALSRLLPRSWRVNVSGHDQDRSIICAARMAARNSIPFAFM
jgi:hypothetical protein